MADSPLEPAPGGVNAPRGADGQGLFAPGAPTNALSPERYLAWLYSPQEQRPVLSVLCQIEAEVAASLRQGIEHHVAHARLQWWRDECERAAQGRAAHPLTRELVRALGSGALRGPPSSATISRAAAAAATASGAIGNTATRAAPAPTASGDTSAQAASTSAEVGAAAARTESPSAALGDTAAQVALPSSASGNTATHIASPSTGSGNTATHIASPSTGSGNTATHIASPSTGSNNTATRTASSSTVIAGISGFVDTAVWDLAGATFETRKELTAYCERWAVAMFETAASPLGSEAAHAARSAYVAEQLAQPGAARQTPGASLTPGTLRVRALGAAVREVELLAGLAREAHAGRIRVPLDELERAGVDVSSLAKTPWPEALVNLLRERHESLRETIARNVAQFGRDEQASIRGLLVWAEMAWRLSWRAQRALPDVILPRRYHALADGWHAWRAAHRASAGKLRLAHRSSGLN